MYEIVKAGARAAAVTRQLLPFSRQQVLTPTVIGLAALVRELAPALERVLGADRRLEIVAGTGSWRVVADRMQVEQVLVNLVANARDATETGGVVVVRVERVEFTDAEARAEERS